MKKEYLLPIKHISAIVFSLLFLLHPALGQGNSEGITYVDLAIDQPNVENCYATDVINFDHQDFIRIYPNPNHGVFQLRIENSHSGEKLNLIAYNLSGEKVFEQKQVMESTQFETQLDFSSLPNGIYVLRLKLGDKEYSKNIILL